MADLLNLPAGTTGYLVKTVAKDSPAEVAGLRGGNIFATIGSEQIVLGGDILLSVEGIPAGPVANLVRIREHMNSLKPGAPFKATILRAGRVLELTGKTPSE
jgi:serine protease Do